MKERVKLGCRVPRYRLFASPACGRGRAAGAGEGTARPFRARLKILPLLRSHAEVSQTCRESSRSFRHNPDRGQTGLVMSALDNAHIPVPLRFRVVATMLDE
jgi:hypothetical protein